LENGNIKEKTIPNYLQNFGICCTFAKETTRKYQLRNNDILDNPMSK
jgi:hypothetical protein